MDADLLGILGQLGTTDNDPKPPQADPRFMAALRFVAQQEAPARMAHRPLAEQLAGWAGINRSARQQYENRNPGQSGYPTPQSGPNGRALNSLNIFHDIYQQVGADTLPPRTAAVHFDTAVNLGPTRARRFLRQSGGDPQQYLDFREQFYRDSTNTKRYPGLLGKRMPAVRDFVATLPEEDE